MELLNIRAGIKVIDATLGLGGHTREILKRIKPGGSMLVIDKDKESLNQVLDTLGGENAQIEGVHSDYRNLSSIMQEKGWESADAILLDAGVSSVHLDKAERGFAIKEDGPLDMRMDRSQALSAFHIVNEWSEEELSEILKNYGEERFAKRISKAIVQDRERKPFERTKELSDMICRVVGRFYRKQRIHPATRSFQAIRMAVNDELDALQSFLDQAIPSLNENGRLGIISFHSLEDRIVKHHFKSVEKNHGGGGAPCVKILTKKPVSPSLIEIEENPRARSAKLRVVEKTSK